MKKNVLQAAHSMKSVFCFLGILLSMLISSISFGQTNPVAQSLPYSQDFSSLALGTETTYPAGWQGWAVSTSAAPSSGGRTNAPTGDKSLLSGTAASTSNGVYNYTNKIGFLSSASTDNAIVLAINTTGATNVGVSFDAMTIRNTHNGTTNFIFGLVLQYRVGTSGVFTNLSYSFAEYQNAANSQQITGVAGQNIKVALNAMLPSACDGQAVVQIRWIYKTVSGTVGTDGRPTMAIDNVYVGVATSAISPLSYSPNDAVSVSFTANGTYTTGFKAQLSDANGSFASPIDIGSTASNVSGTINATIPGGTTAGANYRIRVVSNSPSILGSDNGANITIASLNNYYYKGSGALDNVTSWGKNTDGSGANPTDFTTAGQIFNIRNATAVTTATTASGWTISGAGSKVVLNDNASTAITLTIAAGKDIVTPANTFNIVAPASGGNTIVYQNTAALSFGSTYHTGTNVTYDGNTMSDGTTGIYGACSLINNATINFTNTPTFSSLNIATGSAISLGIGSSTYIIISNGGSVVINGTYRHGKTLGFVSSNVVTASSSFNSLQFIGAENLTLGASSTIEYNRTSNSAAQIVDARTDYANLTLSGTDNFKTLPAAALPIAGNLTVNIAETATRPGSSVLSLAGATTVNGNLILTAGSITTGANNLTLGAAASASLEAGTALNITGGTTNFAGRPVTLKSNAAGTARISAITGNNTTTGLLNATNVTTQLYIPGGRRAYRFLGHPFSNTLNMGSLIDNVYITGDGTTAGTGSATTGTGFDATSTNIASSFWFDNTATSPGSWKAFTSTSDNSWSQYRGIRLLVRGNRYQPTALTAGNPTPNADTLDMTGSLNLGALNISVPTAGSYHLISNPYPSPVDIGTVIDATANIGTLYWVWNANAAGINNRGAYVQRIVGGGAYSLAMNGAFFVQPTASTSLAFTESNKQSAATQNLSRTATLQDVLELNLLYNNGQADNLFIRNAATASASTDAQDGVKLLNPDINMYTLSTSSSKLGLDSRPIQPVTIIPLGFTTTAAATYSISIASNSMNPSIDVYVKDKLLNTEQLLTASANFTFTVTADAATQGENRFELVFRSNGTLPISFLAINAAQQNTGIEVSWNTANETNMNSYEIEESADGSVFTKSTAVLAKNTVSNSYSWYDANVANGNNFYRIKAIEKSGSSKYSNIVNVKIGGKSAEFVVYPNPVKGGIVNLQMNNIEKGVYTITFLNAIGQKVVSKIVELTSGSSTQTISTGSSLAAGTYQMQVINNGKIVTTTKVVVE